VIIFDLELGKCLVEKCRRNVATFEVSVENLDRKTLDRLLRYFRAPLLERCDCDAPWHKMEVDFDGQHLVREARVAGGVVV
jgi:hypothetical protein